MSIVPLPWCDRCGRPVERLEHEYVDFLSKIRFRVWCHGEHESMTVDESVLIVMRTISPGVAFRQSRTLAPAEPRALRGVP